MKGLPIKQRSPVQQIVTESEQKQTGSERQTEPEPESEVAQTCREGGPGTDEAVKRESDSPRAELTSEQARQQELRTGVKADPGLPEERHTSNTFQGQISPHDFSLKICRNVFTCSFLMRRDLLDYDIRVLLRSEGRIVPILLPLPLSATELLD